MKTGKWLCWLMLSLVQVAPVLGRAAQAQGREQMVRLSKLVIDPAHLAEYKTALKEEIAASMRLEAGVLTLYAVFEAKQPTRLTILEIYADRPAYEAHLKTPHFLKYKTGTQHMVTSLELIDGVPLIPELKIK